MPKTLQTQIKMALSTHDSNVEYFTIKDADIEKRIKEFWFEYSKYPDETFFEFIIWAIKEVLPIRFKNHYIKEV